MKRWYIVTTAHGKEDSVAEAIMRRAENAGLMTISEVLVPKEWRLEYRGKKPKPERVQRVIYPGYVFVEVEVDPEKGVIDPETWSVIRHTPGVKGFISTPDHVPIPVQDNEMKKVLLKSREQEAIKVDLQAGDEVEVRDGALKGLTGIVVEVDHEKQKVYVKVNMFGREVISDLDAVQVKKKG
ncbi:transcription termination/antitermination protein NusG [Coprothermobacteraceae bacterium]|nr:transcription termination/antitermination protein NusG [Coprothermobacteraceae bacterium]